MRFAFLFSMMFLLACNNNTSEKENPVETSDGTPVENTDTNTSSGTAGGTSQSSDPEIKPVTVESSVSTTCYTYDKDGSKISLRVVLNGNSVTGNLDYALKEKDKSSGIITGEMHGDTLIAKYIFSAEGKKSRREVAFLKKGKDMIEGYGEQKKAGLSFVFSDRSALQFPGTMVLTGKSCL